MQKKISIPSLRTTVAVYARMVRKEYDDARAFRLRQAWEKRCRKAKFPPKRRKKRSRCVVVVLGV